MNQELENNFSKLAANLEDQVKIYRHLLEVVRKEKEILISANLDELNENNKSKEAMLLKLRAHEVHRVRLAAELSTSLGLSAEAPRLLEMANYLPGEAGERLRNLHSVLNLLIKRVQEYNKQNENLVNSALENITGAMKAIRDTLKDKPTYEKKGKKETKDAPVGRLVSREA